jgi:hypothetical protein
MRRASHSREADVVSLMTSFAMTGTATGLETMGRKTRTASTTQLFPKPVFAGPCAIRHGTTTRPSCRNTSALVCGWAGYPPP